MLYLLDILSLFGVKSGERIKNQHDNSKTNMNNTFSLYWNRRNVAEQQTHDDIAKYEKKNQIDNLSNLITFFGLGRRSTLTRKQAVT